jgi:hypothetical protein
MTTPAWQAPISGAQNNLNATDASAHHNQFLSTHAFAQLGYGNPVVRPTNGDQGYFTHATGAPALNISDFAQSFTMSGTTIGRVTLPLKTFGNGADVLVSLCSDSGGVPNTSSPLCQVKVPASVLTATGAQLGLENANTVWQMPYNNTFFATNFSPTVPWLSPAASINGSPSYFATCTSGNFSLLLGGYDTTANVASALCFTAQYQGAGTVAAPISQPALPQATYQATCITTPDTVVFMGGTTTSPANATIKNVWSASWDSSTGTIGAWSSQAALPTATTNAASASWGETVYYVGGNTSNTIASGTANVYFATVSNNQISAWKSGPSLPRALSLPFVAAINGWLIVAGGVDTSNTARAETYYAQINSDGSLENWQQGPNLFQAIGSAVASWCTGIMDNALVTYAGTVTGGGLGSYISVLTVSTDNGPAPSWNVFKNDAPGTVAMSAFTDGNGVWYLMGYNTNNTVAQNFFQAVPIVSVPLYMTGLTNGATYWVVIQETQNASNSDYVGIGLNFGVYPDAKNSLRHQNTWSTFFSGVSVPLTVYDTTLTNPIIHTVEDLLGGVQSTVYQKWSTLAYGNNGIQTGIIEVTMQPNNALNKNPTFTSGVSPWTATNGTITQSSAQTHGGFAFSGLLTPTGGFTQAYVSSEQFPAQQTTYGSEAWYLATGWFYSPTGTSSFSLSVNWADSSGAYISTTSNTITLVANTWTQVSNWVTPPATAAYASLVPTEGGSPGPTNLIYISDCYMIMAPENVEALTSIAQINYQTGTSWPPVGVTQLN